MVSCRRADCGLLSPRLRCGRASSIEESRNSFSDAIRMRARCSRQRSRSVLSFFVSLQSLIHITAHRSGCIRSVPRPFPSRRRHSTRRVVPFSRPLRHDSLSRSPRLPTPLRPSILRPSRDFRQIALPRFRSSLRPIFRLPSTTPRHVRRSSRVVWSVSRGRDSVRLRYSDILESGFGRGEDLRGGDEAICIAHCGRRRRGKWCGMAALDEIGAEEIDIWARWRSRHCRAGRSGRYRAGAMRVLDEGHRRGSGYELEQLKWKMQRAELSSIACNESTSTQRHSACGDN